MICMLEDGAVGGRCIKSDPAFLQVFRDEESQPKYKASAEGPDERSIAWTLTKTIKAKLRKRAASQSRVEMR